MSNLLKENQEDNVSRLRVFSILIIPSVLIIIDQFLVRRDGDYIVIGETALQIGDIILLFFLALALVALMRPMDQKKYYQRNDR